MLSAFVLCLSAGPLVAALPWVASQPGVDTSLLERATSSLDKRQTSCPTNPNHQPAAPYNSQFPYTGAQNGLPGSGKGGILVPAKGDTAHAFIAPGSNDIRGPCPGMNTLANHGFLARDGLTNFNELMDAQQNAFNLGYDLALLLAVIGISQDGDVLTGTLSIGCTATGSLLAGTGLDTHNKFESDASLTRNDYFLSPDHDNFSFNGTLFGQMAAACGNSFSISCLSKYKKARWQASAASNSLFFYGPIELALYGAASFLYEVWPSFGNAGPPTLANTASFFGAKQTASGAWVSSGGERIPPGWYSRRSPYTLAELAVQAVDMYSQNPVLFGANAGAGNFDGLNSGSVIVNGKLGQPTVNNVMCLLYAAISSGSSNLDATAEAFVTSKLAGSFSQFGC